MLRIDSIKLFDAIPLRKKTRKRLLKVAVGILLVLNLLSYCGAYAMTHFNAPGQWGLGFPRAANSNSPDDVGLEYITQRIPINPTEWLETWFIPVQKSASQESAPQASASKGTVLLFPGNGGTKGQQLLGPAKVFHRLGYDTLLVDFRGVGGSSGNTTTLGVREATDVALAMSYAQSSNFQHPFVLYGLSMGSAAVLRAVAHEGVNPDAVILELPFAHLLDAVRSRVKAMHLPVFPTSEMMVFWGSLQHGFNGFAHNPAAYAKQVKCPTLVFHGGRDRWTSTTEVNQIFQNLPGRKQLVISPNTGHSLLLTTDKKRWRQDVSQFLEGV